MPYEYLLNEYNHPLFQLMFTMKILMYDHAAEILINDGTRQEK